MAVTLNASTSSGLVTTADNSGQIVFQSNGTNAVTVPNTGTGTVAVQGVSTNIVSGTAVNSTSGTSILFTGIPSWAKRVTVMFRSVNTSGSSIVQIQLGSGSVTTSGYKSTASYGTSTNQFAAATTGFITDTAYASSSLTRSGAYVFSLLGSNTWVGSGNMGGDQTGLITFACAGTSPSLSGALDRVNITTVNGTDTFAAGSINILWE